MKRVYSLFFTLLVLVFKVTYSQEVIQLNVDKFGYLENQENIPGRGESDADFSGEVVPTIKGELNVNAQGALTYNIPVEVFKGVNNFQPNVTLAYSSDGGNGQAGYGWNIVGVSSITRGGKVKQIDGVYEGAQFDGNDPYYLDGQRLIGFNEDTPNTAVTEIYSTIKISKITEGNYRFMVQYSDGKIAKYVKVAPRQYSVGLMIDSYGNEIEYNYSTENNTSYLESISYGKTTGSHPFTITFERRQKEQPIKAYRNGLAFINSNILKSISVSSTEDGLYRKYVLTHDISSLGQERLRKIDVENKVSDRLKTLTFNYSDTEQYEIEKSKETNAGLTTQTKELGNVTMGDFEGNGNISAVYVLKEDGANRLVSSKRGTLSIEGDFFNPKLYTGKIIDSSGKVSERDQLLTINESFDSYTIINGNHFSLQKITFTFKDLVTNEESSMFVLLPQGYKKEVKGWCDAHYGDLEYRVRRDTPRYFVVGDFNSDGLMDIIVHQQSQKGAEIENPIGTYCEGDTPLAGEIETKLYFFEIGKLVNSYNEVTSLSPYEYTNNGLADKEHYVIEFDGDGIPDILQLDKETHKIDVLKIDHFSKKIKTILSQFELDHSFTDKTPLILGDYNGDGLTDFLTPKRIFELTQDNNIPAVINQLETGNEYLWNQYIATGVSFNRLERDFTSQKLSYLAPSSRYYIKESGSFFKKLWSGPTYEYSYSDFGASSVIPVDFNNDGKTDLVSFKKFGKAQFKEKLTETTIENYEATTGFISDRERCENQCPSPDDFGYDEYNACIEECSLLDDTPQERSVTNKLVFIENTYDKNNEFDFKTHYESEIDLNSVTISPFSFFINSQENGGLDSYRSKLILHDPHQRKDHVFSVNSKEFFENRIKEVDNGSGVIQQVEYTPLQKTFSCHCSGGNKENCQYKYNPESLDLPFPYFIHKQVPAKFMVSKINTLFDDSSITKEYRYENAIQHLDGKGFLGFEKTYISDPYESHLVNSTYLPKNLQEPVFWKINKYNPLLENQLVETRYGELKGDYFTKSQLSYTKYEGNDYPKLKEHQYIYYTSQEENHDRIKNITITKTYNYDEQGDLLLLDTHTDYNGQGTSMTSITYKDEWSVGKHYYNGKIKTISETINAYGDTFTTSDEYSDFNSAGIALTHNKYGNNTSAITTEVTYNSYGNKTSETVFAEGVAPLTTTLGYDTTQRYVTTITNPEGQEAVKTIDIYGKTQTETSALGLMQEHYYDHWGNPTYSKDYLGNETHLVKEGLDDGNYTLTTTTPGEPQTMVTFDKFDRQIKVKTQSINGKWVVVDTEYDVYGRKRRVSEPYFDNESPTLWSITEYDDLSRPTKQTLYTGKTISTCYNGMSVVVDDGEQKTAKTLDVFGNVIRHKDYGGEITYHYYPNGTLKEANYDGVVVKVTQDGWGNKTRLEDPSAGVYEYEYDALGRKLKEVTPKGATTYTYNDYGKLRYEIREGDNTALSLQYEYNPTTKLPVKIYGSNGKDKFEYETKYDEFYRIKGKVEKTSFFIYETTTTFDEYGRAELFKTKTEITANGQVVETLIKNLYDVNGLNTQLVNQTTGKTLWEINEVNAKGRTTQMQFGNGYQVNQSYDSYFFPQATVHTKGNKTALRVDYFFDAQKGLLVSRNNDVFNKNEAYEYDDLYRLTQETLNDSVLNVYAYDKRGRITYNSEVGKYQYKHTDYQVQQIGFNEKGQELVENRGFHNMVYNAYKKAVSIHLAGKEQINFDYNPFQDRVAMYYGSEDEDIDLRPLRKYYSSDKAVEIKHNLQTGDIEVLTYLDGDPYSAHVVQRNRFYNGNNSPPELLYLHRDYQSSILAITAQDGSILEQRYFDAWGSLKEYKDAAGVLMVVTEETNVNLILDRGYTGHEHLWGVDLVHMNGRLYDAKMRRFLSPDNFIQNPYNTQNFNRYGYVLNNPLIYSDPSGEIFFTPFVTALFVGAGIGVATNTLFNLMNGQKWWYGMGKATVVGAVSGAISFGIGSVATSASSTFVGQAAFQAGAHGMLGGTMSLLDGGDFGSGFLSGMVSSIVSSAVTGLGTKFHKIELGASTLKFRTPSVFTANNKFLFKAIQIASGGLSGGISSSISGGNFWKGVRQGVITSGLNHAANHLYGNAKKYIDSTEEAFEHYYKGKGEAVGLGPETIMMLLKNSKFVEKYTKIKEGRTSLMDGNFAIDMTWEIVHVGRTNVDYSINCGSGKCTVIYRAFVRDGFWDPDVANEFFSADKVFGEGFLPGDPTQFIPDGKGPNLEIEGGVPYDYIPTTLKVSFSNPGYNN